MPSSVRAGYSLQQKYMRVNYSFMLCMVLVIKISHLLLAALLILSTCDIHRSLLHCILLKGAEVEAELRNKSYSLKKRVGKD